VTTRVAFLLVLAAAAAMVTGLYIAGFGGRPIITDTPVYRLYGERIVSGDIPYRDFVVEYPPGALVPFVLAALFSSTSDGYDAAFQDVMIFALALAAVLIVLSLAALGASALRMVLAVGVFLTGIAVLGPFLLTRFDLYAAAVTLAAVCAILHRRRYLGPALLGVAIATKIYPAVLLPLLVTRIWRCEGRAAALRGLALTVGTAVAIYLPFMILAPEGVARSI